MTARRASGRLYVAFVALLTAIATLAMALLAVVFNLAASALNLLARGAMALSTALGKVKAPAPARPKPIPPAAPTMPKPASIIDLAPVPRPPPLPNAGPSNAERVGFALKGMGFRTPDVERALKSLGEEVERQPLDVSIKTALRAVSS